MVTSARVSPVADNSCFLEYSTWISPAPANSRHYSVLPSLNVTGPLTCISWIFSSSSGLMPSWPPITVSRSLLRLLFPVTETVTSTGLMATAAAAVRRAIPARGAIRSASGLAWVAPLRSAAEMFRHYFLTRIRMSSIQASVCVNCQSGHFLHSLSSKMMMELGKTWDLD